jgi:hypothetical protein
LAKAPAKSVTVLLRSSGEPSRLCTSPLAAKPRKKSLPPQLYAPPSAPSSNSTPSPLSRFSLVFFQSAGTW